MAMADREQSPSYQMLPRSARRVFAAIERAIGDVSTQTISTDLGDFQVTGKSKPAKTASNPKGAGRKAAVRMRPWVLLALLFDLPQTGRLRLRSMM